MINLRPRPQHWRSALLTGGIKTNSWGGGHIKIQIFNSTFYLLRLKYNFQHNEYGFFKNHRLDIYRMTPMNIYEAITKYVSRCPILLWPLQRDIKFYTMHALFYYLWGIMWYQKVHFPISENDFLISGIRILTIEKNILLN